MSKRILFVDDEDWSVTPYFEILQDKNIEVDLAENSDQAIDLLRKKKYNLIVLDIMFAPGTIMGDTVPPRKAGSTLLSKVRNNEIPDLKTDPDVPVLILTAVTNGLVLDNIRDLHVEEICRKPAEFNEVIDKILDILEI
ncbi:MAG TPA: response regulator [bacterium]